jgi:hypothetical protein
LTYTQPRRLIPIISALVELSAILEFLFKWEVEDLLPDGELAIDFFL